MTKNYVLEVLVLDELDDDVLLGLDLEHLEHEAEEWGRLYVTAKHATDELKLHRLNEKKYYYLSCR